MAATIKTIAKETGLSLTTVSKYLNGGNCFLFRHKLYPPNVLGVVVRLVWLNY